MTPSVSAAFLVERYDAFLLDAYGVLITSDGPIEGAAEFLAHLRDIGAPFVVVTNDASRSAEGSAASYRRRGLEVDPGAIVTAGSLLQGYFDTHSLSGRSCCVLGTTAAAQYAVDAGGHLVGIGEPADIVIIADEAGYDFIPAIDDTLSMIVERCRAGSAPRLILPNPDRVYPKGGGRIGVASGGIAALIEASLRAALGADAPTFDPLGKPHRALFDEGVRRLGVQPNRALMIGDQLETDIRGALGAGIDAALVQTGINRQRIGAVTPTWILDGLRL